MAGKMHRILLLSCSTMRLSRHVREPMREIKFGFHRKQSICCAIKVTEDFLDHSTVSINLQIPEKEVYVHRWPRPAKIPWEHIDTSNWNPTCSTSFTSQQDPTVFLRNWAHDFEHALVQHATATGTETRNKKNPLRTTC